MFPRGQVLCAIVLSWQIGQQTCPHENGESPFIVNKLITNQGVTPFPSPFPSLRNIAISADGSNQAEFDSQGFIWEDYYRPMTFQSVLTSLMSVTDSSWQRQVVKYLTAAGEVAGGLVGITSIAGKFGNKTYSDAVAFGVGVIVPEVGKILLDDLSQHINNLQSASLDTIKEVPPNGVVDGYIFFPKGPIYGYGIDEFSITEPSFIVNIDNTDVQVEAALVEQSYKLDSGIKSSGELTTDALSRGISKGIAEKEILDSIQSKAKASRLRILQKDIDECLGSRSLTQLLQKSFSMNTYLTTERPELWN